MAALLPSVASAQTMESFPSPPCVNVRESISATDTDFPQTLEVEVARAEIKKWIQNQLRALNSRTANIPEERKKKFSATVRWVRNGKVCESAADVRMTGDWKDHLGFDPRTSHPISSIAVRLHDHHINGITRFKLLLPQTRNGSLEILTTLVFREFGFLAPKTHIQRARINGAEFDLLFQEVPAKEMLETASLRESLIVEGDERAIWELITKHGQTVWSEVNGFALPDNAKWIDNPTAEQIALGALNIHARMYAQYLSQTGEDFIPQKQLPAANRYIRDESLFVLLSKYFGASHGLRPHNRKLYFDPMYWQFRPIYYDGNPAPFLAEFEVDARHFLHQDYVRLYEVLSDPATRGRIYDRYKASGGTIEHAQIIAWFDNILRINELLMDEWENAVQTEPAAGKLATIPGEWDLGEHLKRHQLAEQRFLGFNTDAQTYQICAARGSEAIFCDSIPAIGAPEYFRDPRAQDGRILPLVGNFRISAPRVVNFGNSTVEDRSNNPLPGDYVVKVGSTLWWHFDERAPTSAPEFNVRLVSEKGGTGKLVVSGVIPDGAKFIINSTPVAPTGAGDEVRYDTRLLTSCLTFIDAQLQNTHIVSRHATCEDGVNFLRSDGRVASLVVDKAAADAIDADFSTLAFDAIDVSDAGNDCIDFSMGSYTIASFVGRRCGDKGISVGEQAQVTVEQYRVESATAAVVVKDGAVLRIGDGLINDVRSCFQAYRKKQEFDGGLLIAPLQTIVACGDLLQVQAGSEIIGE